MNSSWKAYLIRHGAIIENDHLSHFGNFAQEIEAAQSSAVLCDLSHFGILQFEGEEAKGFLQGQLSNDVTRINSEICQHTAYCSPKGRILAGGLLIQSDTGYWMQLPLALTEPIKKRLSMFILRAKVKISDVSDRLVMFGLSGPRAQAILEQEIGFAPKTVYAVARNQGLCIVGIPAERFELIVPADSAPQWWERLARHAMSAGSGCWDWLSIRAGIAVITPQTQDQFVPQMVNYEAIGGVSFDKGCYPGQEIVARTKYLGKLNRRMYLAHLDAPASPGDALFSQDMGDQPCGAVVNAAPAPNGGFDLLAVLMIKSVQHSTIHWASMQGPEIRLLALPYSIDTG